MNNHILQYKLKKVLLLFISLLTATIGFTQKDISPTSKDQLLKLYNSYKKDNKQEISFDKFLEINKHVFENKKNSTSPNAQNTLRINDCNSLHTVCGNGDFESGSIDLSQWRGGYGTWGSGQPNPLTLTEGIISGPINNFNSHQTVVGVGPDPHVPIPRVAPDGGNYALRIGNDVNGYGTEFISKTFLVTADKTIFPFRYALVFEDPNHTVPDQPAFSVRAFNCAGVELPNICDLGNGSNIAISDASNPFFQSAASGSIAYKNWSQAQINLSAYVGQIVTIVFLNKDCGRGGHYGYTYIDNLCTVCTSGCPYNLTLNKNTTSPCGVGQICFDYSLPSSNNSTGNLVIDLDIYQNGVKVGATQSSPLLTSGTTYCFNINPSLLGLDPTAAGFDFVGTGRFTINSFPLSPVIVGQIPDGQTTGQNNDYLMSCNTPPVAVCKPLTISTNNDCQGNANAVDFDGGSTDAEGDPLTYSVSPAGPYSLGTTPVVLTVTDPSGASSSCNTTVTVVDDVAPAAICKPATVTLVNGTATITAADLNDGSTDNCGIKSITVSQGTFTCNNIGSNTVTLTVTDNSNNTSTCTATVTVLGEVPSCSIASIPSNNTYTGGVPTNIYLGYGPQSTTLQVTAPASGAPYTYSWSPATGLNSTTSSAPVFTPTAEGTYNFTVTVTNKYGCSATCNITICVLDIRVPGTNGKKVYVCHVPQGNPGNAHTIEISVNAVPAHIFSPGHGDHLGTCDQQPCGTAAPAPVTTSADVRTGVTTVEKGLGITASPNPSRTTFTLYITGNSNAPINLSIMDMNGRQIEARSNLKPNQAIQAGSNFKPGTYLVVIVQGKERKTIQVIKSAQ